MNGLVIGIDFGTDSVRSVLIDASDGREVASDVFYYPRWHQGLYCNPVENQFRQHPLDYLEGLESTIKTILTSLNEKERLRVRGISVDTTGSTPVAVDRQGKPLSLSSEFEENPNAMFILWKDHTAILEANQINGHAQSNDINYLQYVGGIYSSEWFWAKALHILREDESVRNAAFSWAEHCDWIPFLLSGGNDVMKMKRSRCAAGHKALWHESYGGLPPNHFWTEIDPLLDGLHDRLYTTTHTSDVKAGQLSQEWAEKLGLHTEVAIGVGGFDAHIGAVGGEIKPYVLSRIIGTSTCDILMAPNEEVGDTLVKGICGQVDGSVVPGMLGMEAGQSAFGDVYAWFKNLIAWPIIHLMPDLQGHDAYDGNILDKIIPALNKAASQLPVESTHELAIDWMNGRRTPDANQTLKGALININLGSDAPRIFKSLVEATCFGSRAIVERFREEGIEIREIIALGGVAKKSPFVMQTMSDILNMPIRVAKSEQTCALGAAMFAATVAGLYPDVMTAQKKMGQGFETEYVPGVESVEYYSKKYVHYRELGKFLETKSK